MGDKETAKTTITVSSDGYRGLLKVKHEMEGAEARSISFAEVVEKMVSDREACTCGAKKAAG